jgi:2-methylaconitate cis-trans-isomerase PrpF
MLSNEQSVPFAYIRGGTSKALFFHEHDIPRPGIPRDRFLRRVMGSPDPLQIDGMGGTHVVTSKVAIIKPSQRADADVDYTFAQVGIDNPVVGYDGNCGNISAGVGPFAIDEGLVREEREGASIAPEIKAREVRIYNTGTGKVLISHVPIARDSGRALETGNFAIAGCPGTGAPILMDYRNVCFRSTHPSFLALLG